MPEQVTEARAKTSRNLYAFGATSFFNDTASEMAYWVLPAFLVSLGAGPDKLGFIEGVAESVASFAKLLSGFLADRFARRKPIVVSGYIVANAVKPVLAVTTVWWQVLLIRFSDRLAKGIRGTPRDVMLSESVERHKTGAAFGLLQAMDSAGAIAGPLLALWILAHYSMRGVFWAAVLPGFLAIVVAIFGIRETGKSVHDGASSKARIDARQGEIRLPMKFYYVLFAVTLFSLGNSSDMFLVLRAENLGINASHAPLLGLVFNITYTLVSYPAGRLSDRFSKRAIAAAGYLVFAAVYLVFASGPSTRLIWITMACYGLFYALTNPVLRALVAGSVKSEVRGRAFGIYYFATSVATLLASIVTGELWKRYGPALPFYVSAAMAVISAGLLLVSRRTNHNSTVVSS
jgi:MFS family permease